MCPASVLGKKAPGLFSLFIFIHRPTRTRQSIDQNQTQGRPGPLAYGKPPSTAPNNAAWLQSCLHETAEDTDEHHTPHVAPLPTPPPHPGENNPVQHLGGLNNPYPPPTPEKLKAINSKL
jgi:hypothetical protein